MAVRPSVSVIVPVFNQEMILPITLPAITSLEDVDEILFVDDGSTDASSELLRGVMSLGSSVRVLHHPENRGRAVARNTGISEARGEVILFLDADIIPESDLARIHAQRFENPDVVGVLSNDVPDDLDPTDPFHRYILESAGPRDTGPNEPLHFKYFITGYSSVRRSVLEEVGCFDEMVTYGEDLDLAYRIQQQYPNGFRFEPTAIVHQRGIGDLDDRNAALRQFGRNLSYLLVKHPGLAAYADLPRVDSPFARLLLSRRIAGFARKVLPTAPAGLQQHLVRFVLASAVVDGFLTTPT